MVYIVKKGEFEAVRFKKTYKKQNDDSQIDYKKMIGPES